uniref:MAT121 n=1 Tax=Huntiella omanensis TaxID=1580864 RepID=A0A1D9CT27_9PEZI|nr:MAT121 [Huntiella omanensis]
MENFLIDPTLMGPAHLETSALETAGLDPLVYFTVQQQQILQSAWAAATVQISPFSKVAALHANMVLALSEDSQKSLLADFTNVIGAPALLVRDSSDLDRFFIGSLQEFSSTNQSLIIMPGYDHFFLVSTGDASIQSGLPSPISVQGHESDDSNKDDVKQKLPRPPNAYILYRKERHHSVKDEFPGICNNEISRILGRRWKEESETVRAFYKEQSENYKQNFMNTHPDYQYRPRKAGEKKKRNRRVQPKDPENTGLQSPVSAKGTPKVSFAESPI